MKILWYGDPPWLPTGYGRLAKLLLPKLAESGVEIIIQAKAGHQGNVVDLGYAVLYGVTDQYSIDNIPVIVRAHKLDMVIFMADIWAFDLADMKRRLGFTPLVAYFPLDSDTVPESSKFQLINYIDFVVPMSDHARKSVLEFVPRERVMETIYPPIPIDVFKPLETSRADIGFRGFDFVFGMVQMNKDIVRKDQARQLYALKTALANLKTRGIEKKVGIYCHMTPAGGFNLREFAALHGMDNILQYPIPAAYMVGFKDEQMAEIYNGIDALVQCTVGEGFGMPTVEAMLCGTPVIGSMNTSTEEIIRLDEQNYQVPCNEIIFLSPGTNRIASFAAMVDAMEKAIVDGTEHVNRTKLRDSVKELVDPGYVNFQWVGALRKIQDIVVTSCLSPPPKGQRLITGLKTVTAVRMVKKNDK